MFARDTALAIAIATLAAIDGTAAQTANQPPDTMAARVEACTPCHGNKGQGTSDVYFPRLAGKPAGYLYNQLLAFRNGRRKYPPMNYLLEFLHRPVSAGDGRLFRRASIRRCRAGAERRQPGRARARRDARDPAAMPIATIPACASCHGRASPAWSPAIPGLLGLRANYVSAQLGAWRYGTRTAKAPDCMQLVAGHLTEADVTAVAAWLATRPAPANPAPVPKGTYVAALRLRQPAAIEERA